MTEPAGQTPSAPDVDTVDDPTHGGEPDEQAESGRTPSSPGIDEE